MDESVYELAKYMCASVCVLEAIQDSALTVQMKNYLIDASQSGQVILFLSSNVQFCLLARVCGSLSSVFQF